MSVAVNPWVGEAVAGVMDQRGLLMNAPPLNVFLAIYPVFEAVGYGVRYSGIQLAASDTARYLLRMLHATAGYSGIQRDAVDLLQN